MSGLDEERKMVGSGQQRFHKDQYRATKDETGTPNLASFRVSHGPNSTKLSPGKNIMHNRVFSAEAGKLDINDEPLAEEATPNQSPQKSSKQRIDSQ